MNLKTKISKHSTLILIIFLFSVFCFENTAQVTIISGQVIDSTNKKPLYSATVLLKTTDNNNISGLMTDKDGFFQYAKIPKGSYFLTVSFIGYSSFNKTILVDNDIAINLGIIVLSSSSQNLKEVVISDHVVPVKIKGDTTEFNAGAYKTQQNAVAEDLIKKMPGMEVDDNGKVKAQGEEVKKVIVDGKQFFGDDPSLALKNLPAEVIEKVQLIDELTEQAQFTGFDDGTRTRTLNIVTKKNRRKGYFGKIYGGQGSDNKTYTINNKYSAGGNVSYFDENRRISLLGLFNNINEMNFSMQDILGVSSGSGASGSNQRNNKTFESASLSLNRNISQNFMVGNNNGLNQTNSVGLNFNDTWAGSKIEFSGSYFLNTNENKNFQLVNREFLSGNKTNQLNNKESDIQADNYNHRFNFKFNYDIDSANSIMIRPSLRLQNNTRATFTQSKTSLGTERTLNSSKNNNHSITNGYNFQNDIFIRHRFAKPGRTISVSINTSANDKEGKTNKNVEYIYYNLYDQSVNNLLQFASSITSEKSISANLAYTERLLKMGIIQLSYNIRYNPSKADKNTWDFSNISGIYDSLNVRLSNRFDNGYKTQLAGLSFKTKIKESSITIGINYQLASLINDQKYPLELKLDHHFNDFLPYITYTHKLSKKNSLNFNYNTTTLPPGINQLQNVVNNDNPLFVSAGNPDLKQQYTHNLSLKFNRVSSDKSRTIMFLLAGSYLRNRISNSLFISTHDTIIFKDVFLGQGGQFTQPVNLNEPFWNMRTFFTIGLPLFKHKINLNFNSGLSATLDPGLINNAINKSNNFVISEGMVISSNINRELDFTLSASVNYNIVKNSIREDLNNNFYSQKMNFKINYTFWKGLIFVSNTTYLINKGLAQGYNVDYTLWSLSLGKQLFKDKSGELRISVNDLLNENTSINRIVSQNYIEDSRNITLNRYYLMTFIYHLRKFGMIQKKEKKQKIKEFK